MENQNKTNAVEDDSLIPDLRIIDIGKYYRILFRHWKAIFLWGVGAFILGCVFAICSPRKYVVSTKLAPELSSTATSRMSSLASLVGLSSTMLGTTDAVYPMVYPDILDSPAFLAELFDVQVTYSEKDDSVTSSLYDYLLIKQGHVSKEEIPQSDGTKVDPFHFTKEQGRVIRMLGQQINASVDKKTMCMDISVTMQDAVVCATVAKAINEKLEEYVTNYRTEKAKKDCAYYETLYEESQSDYYQALQAYSNYSDSHQGVSLRSSMIESERLKDEAELKYQLYNSNAQQLQLAKAKVQQETPVFAELIPPSVPLKSANSRKKTAVSFGFFGICAGMVFVLFRYRKEEDDKEGK